MTSAKPFSEEDTRWKTLLNDQLSEFRFVLGLGSVESIRGPRKLSRYDMDRDQVEFVTMVQPPGMLVEAGYPDAICVLWNTCRVISVDIDLTGATWETLADRLETGLIQYIAKNDVNVPTQGRMTLEILRRQIADRVAWIDYNTYATEDYFREPRGPLAINNKDFVMGLAYNNRDGIVAPGNVNCLAIIYYTWLRLHPRNAKYTPTNLTRAKAAQMEREIRAVFLSQSDDAQSMTEAEFVELLKLEATTNAEVLGLTKGGKGDITRHIRPRWNVIEPGQIRDLVIQGYDLIDSLTCKDVGHQKSNAMSRDGSGSKSGKDNKSKTRGSSSKLPQLGGGKPFDQPNEDSEDIESSVDDQNDSNGDDEDPSNDESETGPSVPNIRLWRYGVDDYMKSEEELDAGLNKSPWEFPYYHCVHGAINRKSMPPQHTIFGNEVTGELFKMLQSGEVTGSELRRWYPGIFSGDKGGIRRDVPPLGLPCVMNGNFAEACQGYILCGQDALEGDFECDVNEILKSNAQNRNKRKKKLPWHTSLTIDAFTAKFKKANRHWLSESDLVFDPENVKCWPVEVDLASINADEAWLDKLQHLRGSEDSVARRAVQEFVMDVRNMKNDIAGFVHPKFDGKAKPTPVDYDNPDVITCSKRLFVGRSENRKGWAPADEALAFETIQSSQNEYLEPEDLSDNDDNDLTKHDHDAAFVGFRTRLSQPNSKKRKTTDDFTDDEKPVPKALKTGRLLNVPSNQVLFDRYMHKQLWDQDIENQIVKLFIEQDRRDEARLKEQATISSTDTTAMLPPIPSDSSQSRKTKGRASSVLSSVALPSPTPTKTTASAPAVKGNDTPNTTAGPAKTTTAAVTQPRRSRRDRKTRQ